MTFAEIPVLTGALICGWMLRGLFERIVTASVFRLVNWGTQNHVVLQKLADAATEKLRQIIQEQTK